MEKTEIAIVGASAAGLTAAIAAARAGADVTLIEAKDEIGVPAAPAITAMDSLWPREVDQPDHTVTRRLAGIRLRGRDGRGPFIDGGMALVNRTRFDQYLAQQAREEGVHVLTGVKDVQAHPDRSLTADGLELANDLLMFADGARSQVSRFFEATQDPEAMQWVGVMEFEAPEPESDGRVYNTLGTHAPGGRSQLNPLGDDRWVHWTFFRGSRDNAERMAQASLDLDARLMGWEDLDAKFMGAGADPLYTLPNRLYDDRVVATGGAAGQGGFEVGLHSGLLAGDVAARFLRGEARLSEYETRWKKQWLGKYVNLRNSNEALLRLTDDEICAVAGAWHGRHVGDMPKWHQLARNPRGVFAVLKAARIAKKRAPGVTA